MVQCWRICIFLSSGLLNQYQSQLSFPWLIDNTHTCLMLALHRTRPSWSGACCAMSRCSAQPLRRTRHGRSAQWQGTDPPYSATKVGVGGCVAGSAFGWVACRTCCSEVDGVRQTRHMSQCMLQPSTLVACQLAPSAQGALLGVLKPVPTGCCPKELL